MGYSAPRFLVCCWLVLSGLLTLAGNRVASGEEAVDVGTLTAKLREVDREGQGHRGALEAWPRLAAADANQLPEILAGMDGANPLACNWIRLAVDAVVQRHLARGGKLPAAALEEFFRDTKHTPRARRLAYELLVTQDPGATKRLVPGLLNDPSLELRRDAVAMTLEEAEASATQDREAAIALYRRAWDAARDLGQAQAAAAKLRELGVATSLSDHFGFVMDWQLIGPFDNHEDVGFDKVYPPEQELNLAAEYPGKLGPVRWMSHRTQDELGVVDLNSAFGRPKAASGNAYADVSDPKFKGAIAYAFSEFVAAEPRDVEVRIGCINGHKVWLNGELMINNHVFHTGRTFDQYVAKGKLKQGKNQLLVKVAQNEQSEDWAQEWQFQLRMCDELGTAVLSTDRSR